MIPKKRILESLRNFLLLPICIVFLLAEETYHYTVYFWKIPCVDITMILSEDQQGSPSELTFLTRTKELFSYFFSVDNSYKTVFDPNSFQMLGYEKKIKQSNMKQKIAITWNPEDSTYQYQNTPYKRPKDTHNIFSLMMRGRFMDWQSLDSEWWPVDHEGHLFQSRYLWIDSTDIEVGGKRYPADHYRIDLSANREEDIHLVDKTDVFSWGIFLEGCVRQLWIERGGEKRILRAEVKVRGFTLVAQINDD